MQISRRTANAIAVCLCLLFFITGSLWIWRPGLQQDEALFGAGIYPPLFRSYCVRAWGHEFPLMIMTYVGTLKATIYRVLVFPFFDPSAASIRVPALVIGAVSIWLFYRLCLRLLDARAALAGTALLATDTIYLLTIRCDWGPVALQHFCLLAGVLALARYWQERRLIWLATGFFIFGLGLWDKALFAWSLAALAGATLATLPRIARDLLRPRNAAVALVAFCIGALPLIIFNVRHDWETFRSNARFSTEHLGYKADVLWSTLDGSMLFGYLVREDHGEPRSHLTGYLVAISLLLLPAARKNRRPAAFGAIFAALLWLQMAFTDGAAAVHHAVLLFPAPQFIIAAVLTGVPRLNNRMLTAIVAIACISSLAVTSTYYSKLIRNGGGMVWTEAIWPALDAIESLQPAEVSVLDWGFFEQIRLMHQGRTKLELAGAPNTEAERSYALEKLRSGENLFIAHTQDHQVDPETLKHFIEWIEREGFRRSNIRVFNDLNGRPAIELFRVEPK